MDTLIPQATFEGISFKPILLVKNLHPERRKISKPHTVSPLNWNLRRMKVCISQLEVPKPNSEFAPVNKKCGGQKKLVYVTEKDGGIVASDMAGFRAQGFC